MSNNPPKGWTDSWDCGLCGQLTYFVKDVSYVDGVAADVCDCAFKAFGGQRLVDGAQRARKIAKASAHRLTASIAE